MYTPDLSASVACGNIIPPLTQWQRQNTLSFQDLVETMRCLYSREFRPIFSESDCACVTCYDRGTWNLTVHHATRLNSGCIWNDIIKRWEPAIFDQEFSEDIDTNSGYEFRTYNNIFNINVDNYDSACQDCSFTETNRGMAFVKSFYGETADAGCEYPRYPKHPEEY